MRPSVKVLVDRLDNAATLLRSRGLSVRDDVFHHQIAGMDALSSPTRVWIRTFPPALAPALAAMLHAVAREIESGVALYPDEYTDALLLNRYEDALQVAGLVLAPQAMRPRPPHPAS